MSRPTTALVAAVRKEDRRVCLPVPDCVFSVAVEQLRWDALRTGHLPPERWGKVRASVAPVYLDSLRPASDFAFAVVLYGPDQPVRSFYRPQELQSLCLYLQSRLPWALEAGASVELCWRGGTSLELAAAPLDLPLADVPSRQPATDPPPCRLAVSPAARRQLGALGEESLHRGVELAGCLHGRVAGLDTLAVDAFTAAPDDGASSAEFRFGPRFWAATGSESGLRESRILGWAHSHLCDQGHPRGLSARDLQASHLFFSSPWSVAALVCASAEQPEVRWFGWRDAAIVDLGNPGTLAS